MKPEAIVGFRTKDEPYQRAARRADNHQTKREYERNADRPPRRWSIGRISRVNFAFDQGRQLGKEFECPIVYNCGLLEPFERGGHIVRLLLRGHLEETIPANRLQIARLRPHADRPRCFSSDDWLLRRHNDRRFPAANADLRLTPPDQKRIRTQRWRCPDKMSLPRLRRSKAKDFDKLQRSSADRSKIQRRGAASHFLPLAFLPLKRRGRFSGNADVLVGIYIRADEDVGVPGNSHAPAEVSALSQLAWPPTIKE